MSQQAPIRILVADDHPIVRQGLVGLIENEADMLVVGEAENGQEAVQLFCQHQPDVTLVDLRMPIMDGVTAIAQIRDVAPTARIIILTTYDTDEDIYQGLRVGAVAYLLKDVSRQILRETIRAVHIGQKRILPEIALKLTERITSSELSAREVDVLRLIVAGKSNSEISTALSIKESTVKFHINNILSKLQVSDRTQAVVAALRRGIVTL